MPNRTLRALWVAMAQLRLLDGRLSQIKRRPKASPANTSFFVGEEACRATTAIHLTAGDLISDNGPTHVTDLLRGKPLAEILHSAYSELLGSARRRAALTASAGSGGKFRAAAALLPQAESAVSRLQLAIGAAAALKAAKTSPQQPGRLVLAYVSSAEISAAEWTPLVALIAANSLPILLVVLPPQPRPRSGQPAAGTISHLATRCGVPGILVDSDDPIALYRVATESFGRIRGGDGAVLIECCRLPERTNTRRSDHNEPPDALGRLRQALLERQIATPGWFGRTERTFLERLKAADR